MRISEWSSDVCSSDLGVVRAVERAVALEAVLDGGFGVVQRALLQPSDGIDHHRRGQLAAGQDVVADGNLLVDLGRQQALVDAFVAAAQQDHPRLGRQLPHPRLGQRAALRARSEEHTSELQSLMRISYAVFCLKK